MVSFSKLSGKSLNHLDCSVIHPAPGLTCVQAFFLNMYWNHVSCAKYYLPVLLLPLIVKYRQLDRELFLKSFKKYVETVSSGASITAVIYFLTCLARKISGRFILIWTPTLPIWLSTQLSSVIMPRHVVVFFLTGISHSMLDSCLRYFNNPVTRKLRTSTFYQTIAFMVGSAVILQAKLKKRYDGFWFISAVDNKTKKNAGVKALIGEVQKYFFIGLALDMLNAVSKGPSTGNLLQTCLIKLYNLRFKSTAFLLSYFTMYRLLNFVLTNYVPKFPEKYINLTAAFISGSAYGWINQVAFMTFAMSTSIQVLWHQFCSTKSENEWVNKLKRFQISKVLYPLQATYLISSFFHNPHMINGLSKAFVNATSANNSQRIVNFFHKHDEKALLEKLEGRISRGLFR